MTLLDEVVRGDVEGVRARLLAGESTAFAPADWRKWDTEPAVRAGGGNPTLLHVAAAPHERFAGRIADWECIAGLLLDAGLDVNAREQFAETPLHLAVAAKYPSMAKLLLARGADVNAVNARGLAPIDAAEGNVMFALLLGHGANPNGGSRKGAPANEPSLVERFARYGYDALIRIVLDAGADLALHPHALGVACQYAVTTPSEGHDDAVALLLQRGADPTAALLHLALHLQPNDIEQKTLRILLELGANPNALSASQETPLAIVVKRGLHRHARLLIEKGANVHVRVGGETLYEVAQRSYKAGVSDARLVMQLLKELGVGPVLADAPKPVDVAAPSGPQAGARVAHSKFGGGVITKVDKDMLDVTFDSGEKKSLLAKFVKLL